MNVKCSKCEQIRQNCQILTCGHPICSQCLPSSNYSHEFIVPCPSCSIMTILETSLPPVDANPENYVVCLECKSDVMTTRMFLQSQHRNHDVVSVANIVHDVQKNLRKYQLSFDLESQALYTQVEALSKQKRIICQQYSKTCQQIQCLFQQVKNSIERSQSECTKEYQKLVLEIIENYDAKIKEIKSQIFKCQSYTQCIDHSLIKSNASKYVAATQFYFLNYAKLESTLTDLIQTRKQSLNQISTKRIIKYPNLKPICEIINRLKNLTYQVWNNEDLKKQSPELKKNPQVQTTCFFQLKRKQIFQLNINNENNFASNSQSRVGKQTNNIPFIKQKVAKTQEGPEITNSQAETNQLYNIEGRIQNLRKTLRLGEKKSNSKSYVNLHTGNKLF